MVLDPCSTSLPLPPPHPRTKALCVPCLLFVENVKSPSLPESQKSRLKQLIIRPTESQTQYLMPVPELFYRYCNWWPDCSQDISCSILSCTESTARTVPGTGFYRMRLTLLPIIISVFVEHQIILSCSACVCEQATKTASKEMLQTHITASSTLRAWHHTSAWRNYGRWIFVHSPVVMEWCWQVGICKQCVCTWWVVSDSLQPHEL